MTRFYLSKDDAAGDLLRCRESQRTARPTTITGATENGEIRAFTGVVISIDDDPGRGQGRRWKITIVED